MKFELRRRLRATLRALPTTTKQEGGAAVCAHLAPLLPSAPAIVAFFASTPDELDTQPLDELLRSRGIGRAVPRIDGDDLAFHLVDGPLHALPPDRFGIPTPPSTSTRIDLVDCALVCVPGLGFDDGGGRIGYGRGYYDRALRSLPLQRVIGLFLDEQWVEQVPMDEGDVWLPRLCTPSRGALVVDRSTFRR